MNDVYINSAAQISIQKPLSDEWLTNPITYSEPYARSIEPDFHAYFNPLESRRMGSLFKRALVTSAEALKKAGLERPEAIVTGTGLGCVENTELLLNTLCTEGEELLKPTYFMQSTHNIISSLIAIHTKSHCYNVTYSHRSISFDSALFDAYLQILSGKIGNALVGAHDELTPSYFSILRKVGYLGVEGMVVSSETAVSYVVSNNPSNALCRIAGFRMLYSPIPEQLASSIQELINGNGIPANAKPGLTPILSGLNGNPENDRPYTSLIEANPFLKECPKMRYKQIFGENYTSSAFGLLTAAMYLKENKAERILYLNHSDGKCWSIILLEK